MNSKNQTVSTNRVYFLDNLRWLMVLLVIPLHSLISYAPLPGVEDLIVVPDANFGRGATFLYVFLESFPMEILFFIAGYFAVSSLKKEGYQDIER